MDLVDEKDGVRLVLERLENPLEALLKVATVLGTRQQSPHVQGKDLAFTKDLGHILLSDAPSQALSNGRLAHAGLAHQKRVVLAPPAQDLNHPFDLIVATDQRIDLASDRLRIEIERVLLQG